MIKELFGKIAHRHSDIEKNEFSIDREVNFISAKEVFKARNKFAVTKNSKDRLHPKVMPNISPSFQVGRKSKIFTIGSCFARNIEDNLETLGYELPTLQFKVPAEEKQGRQTALLNKYTPASIYQEIKWTYDIFKRDGVVRDEDLSTIAFEERPGEFIDLNLATMDVVTYDRLMERRQLVYDVFKNVFSSELVTITLGLVEGWFDEKSKQFIQFAPITKGLKAEADRFKFGQLPYPVCLKYINDTIDIIRSENKCNFLITTSPVMLARTFTEIDVITANLESKSILRAVCGEVTRNREYVDYFPSFESAILTKDVKVFLDDDIHVSPEFVGSIVSHLVDAYFSDVNEEAKAHQRALRLFQKGDTQEGIDELMPFKFSEELSAKAAFSLSQGLIRQREFNSAIEVIEFQLSLGRESPDLYSMLRAAFVGENKLTDALQAAETAHALNSTKWEWHFDIANVLFRLERHEEADRIFEIYKDKMNPRQKFQYVRNLIALGKPDQIELIVMNELDGNNDANLHFEALKIFQRAKMLKEMDYLASQAKQKFPEDMRFAI